MSNGKRMRVDGGTVIATLHTTTLFTIHQNKKTASMKRSFAL